jgi:hypothetical protein
MNFKHLVPLTDLLLAPLAVLNDGIEPKNSGDTSISRFT